MLMLTLVWLVLQGTLLLDRGVYANANIGVPGAAEHTATGRDTGLGGTTSPGLQRPVGAGLTLLLDNKTID